MTDIIELAKKCGALVTWDASGNPYAFTLYTHELNAFADAIRQDQIEKDEKEFIHLLDEMITSTIINFTDRLLAVQQLNGVKSQVEAAAAYRRYFQEKQTKQVQGEYE